MVEEDDYEHVKTTASSRVGKVDRKNNTYHRMESGLEADLVTILLARHDTASIKAQDGPHRYTVEGKVQEHIIDVGRVAVNGSYTLFAVKPEGETAERTRGEMKLLNNQLHKDSPDRFVLVTDQDITKARVNLARNILHTRDVLNDSDTARVLAALLELGGCARIWQLAEALPDLYLSAVSTAVWDLFDKEIIVHAHPEPEAVLVSRASWIRVIVKE
ncbi:hypothetical protein ACU8MW_08140 [Rhizobium leguminosarum]